MMICSIASGSSGNCIYVGNEHTHILIDAGVSCKRIEEGLEHLKVNPSQINAILITHEHIDHVRGINIFLKKHGTNVYATNETVQAMNQAPGVTAISGSLFHCVRPDEQFFINDIMISPFSLSHDARNPVGYTLEADGHKIGMATDLGMYDDYIVSKLTDSEILYIEANHDLNMLMVGSYPYSLKQRIAGDRGHLSNESTAKLINSLLHPNLKHILLAHMSKENNYAELAYETIKQEVHNNWQWDTCVPEIIVACRDIPSNPVELF